MSKLLEHDSPVAVLVVHTHHLAHLLVSEEDTQVAQKVLELGRGDVSTGIKINDVEHGDEVILAKLGFGAVLAALSDDADELVQVDGDVSVSFGGDAGIFQEHGNVFVRAGLAEGKEAGFEFVLVNIARSIFVEQEEGGFPGGPFEVDGFFGGEMVVLGGHDVDWKGALLLLVSASILPYITVA